MDDFLPITDEREVHSFLDRIPLRVDRERFTRFVLGFPHRYLQLTAPVETVAHFALFSTLAGRAVSSRLARDGEGWKLAVVAGDRSRLFSRIAGSLTFFGADIVAAEAFSNSEALVLDRQRGSDQITAGCAPRGAAERAGRRRTAAGIVIEVVLEQVVSHRQLRG